MLSPKCFVFLCVVLLLLTGCANKENSYEPAPEYGIMENIYLTAESAEYGRDVKEIVCLLENKSEELFGYGEKFALEKNVGGIWRTVPYKDWSEFILAAAMLPPSESATHIRSRRVLRAPAFRRALSDKIGYGAVGYGLCGVFRKIMTTGAEKPLPTFLLKNIQKIPVSS